ncbi:MAG: hypothetical protein SCL54_00790 [Bacillota bacterium]|nr:hypothetical protein [Bacillota bacterium]
MNTKNLIKSYIFYLISAFGISLTIKAHIGVSSFNSMNVALAEASQIKVGTITTLLNIAFLLIYMRMTHFKLVGKYVLQGFSVLIFGIFINFFTYNLLNFFELSNYGMRILTMIIGTIIGGASVGMIISYNTITFPIESVCNELAERTSNSFMLYRYGIDLFSIAISVLVTLSFDLPFFVREGTIISFILLSFSMSLVRKWRDNSLQFG